MSKRQVGRVVGGRAFTRAGATSRTFSLAGGSLPQEVRMVVAAHHRTWLASGRPYSTAASSNRRAIVVYEPRSRSITSYQGDADVPRSVVLVSAVQPMTRSLIHSTLLEILNRMDDDDQPEVLEVRAITDDPTTSWDQRKEFDPGDVQLDDDVLEAEIVGEDDVLEAEVVTDGPRTLDVPADVTVPPVPGVGNASQLQPMSAELVAMAGQYWTSMTPRSRAVLEKTAQGVATLALCCANVALQPHLARARQWYQGFRDLLPLPEEAKKKLDSFVDDMVEAGVKKAATLTARGLFALFCGYFDRAWGVKSNLEEERSPIYD